MTKNLISRRNPPKQDEERAKTRDIASSLSDRDLAAVEDHFALAALYIAIRTQTKLSQYHVDVLLRRERGHLARDEALACLRAVGVVE